MILKKLFSTAANFFYPRRCIFCGETLEINSSDWTCSRCLKSLVWCRDMLCCEKCGKPVVSYGKRQRCYFCTETSPLYFDKVVSVFPYRPPVDRAIRRYKREEIQSTAKGFGDLVAMRFEEVFDKAEFDIVCGAPAHSADKRTACFDNVELICRAVSSRTGIPAEKALLKKTRTTYKQTELNYHQRLVNLRNSMEVSAPEKVKGKTVLLVDDVCTTRATVIECSRALKAAGAKKVVAVVFATTEKRKIEI